MVQTAQVYIILTVRVRSKTGGYVFTRVCLFRQDVGPPWPLSHVLSRCRGYPCPSPGQMEERGGKSLVQVQVLSQVKGGYPCPGWGGERRLPQSGPRTGYPHLDSTHMGSRRRTFLFILIYLAIQTQPEVFTNFQ